MNRFIVTGIAVLASLCLLSACSHKEPMPGDSSGYQSDTSGKFGKTSCGSKYKCSSKKKQYTK